MLVPTPLIFDCYPRFSSIKFNPTSYYSPLLATSWRLSAPTEMLVEWQHQRPRPPPQVSINSTSPNVLEPTKPDLIPSPTHDGRLDQQHPLKRARLRADVDGEESEHNQKKKRRLRLNLITSRLSKPYATPATHISGRRAMRVGIWSRQKVVGRNLQKAAVLNSMRMNKVAARAAEQELSGSTRMISIYDYAHNDLDAVEHNYETRKCSTKLVPPIEGYSSHFLSVDSPNYDVEYEDDSTDCEEDDESEGDMIYSDFSILDPDNETCDDNDLFFSFGSSEIEQAPLGDSSEKAIGLILENEKHNEVSVAHCVP